MTAGNALRVILAALEMSQADLARHAGISSKHINQIVQGNTRVSAAVAVAVADAIAEHLVALDAQDRIRDARAGRH